jgi:mannan endo-1,4-beta-mannosidase
MNWASQITQAGLPWLYWQVLPNADPHVRHITDASMA